MALTQSDLRAIWSQTLEFLEVDQDFGFFDDIVQRHTEPHRKYHNLEHVAAVIERVDVLIDQHDFSESVRAHTRFAAFYHDIVYVPGWGLNEELSAQYAKSALELLGVNENRHIFVTNAILSTKDHTYRGQSTSRRTLIDADLYQLGDPVAYLRNMAKIYAEFGMPAPDAWKEGRTKFLQEYLNRDTIYALPGQEKLEEQARKNMSEELGWLILA